MVVHIARTAVLAINIKTGKPINKEDPATTIADTLRTEHKHVVIPNITDAPHSANWPTVEQYIKLEAAAGFKVHHMDQTMILTYDS